MKIEMESKWRVSSADVGINKMRLDRVNRVGWCAYPDFLSYWNYLQLIEKRRLIPKVEVSG